MQPDGLTQRQRNCSNAVAKLSAEREQGNTHPKSVRSPDQVSGRGPKANSRNREEKERNETSKRSRVRRNTGILVQEWMAARDGTAQPHIGAGVAFRPESAQSRLDKRDRGIDHTDERGTRGLEARTGRESVERRERNCQKAAATAKR